ncbi:MAG: hypothetical protein COV55_01710 [Candidatus Komeilibacteria bacterium CG11_big_fil_rev_8_21_14_0_20_36_20]|uniref:DUF11 domain-containing protein n=1 Tax=Candidatus Komeilibacteria bacterium CG11_big_fil_rev_8_21_14_0_20_36_20 TaxID=1974477 RepID=A0A2H0NE05_9BACT|nr:MAG: hypothetical protein COV55_01710 [Candidatus Komeilibacteria bacterium CG11_big_fil_rev_8_21_14_0_20_36_20]PIR81259.1 MAG: hypothetical protein COU21_04695 [Candidatus Komeilibacteria bacterium CG10_big_fil_rev_8_21_14_0_10_36_65]PJC55223.1 MAG: hypothetical protein CO027_03635 [Candidatus Komeilibacteria bacterium CG_4_9_14_0_2_um_filter_36_13]
MAKIKKRSIDSIKRAPIRQSSYEAPSVRRKREVPQEYRTLKKAKKKGGSFLWMLFFLFIAAVAGFFYWSKQAPIIVEKSLEFSVSGPDKIISGDQTVYLIEYKNLDVVSLQQVELDVHWPSGFYFDGATVEPTDENATTWLLSDLAPGETADLKIIGQLVGTKDKELLAVFTLNYQPENFHSDFREKQSVKTKITENKLDLSVEAVDKTLVSTEQEIKVIYRNLTDETLNDLYIDILYPDDFDLVEVDPIKEGDYWAVNLEPEEEKIITIKGSFAPDSQPEQLLVAEIGSMSNDSFRRFSRAEKQFVVVNPQFAVNLEINGKSGSQTVNWGDVLRYQLKITNQSETDIPDVQVTALIDSQVLDWGSLDTIGSYLESNIVWTKEQSEDLALWPVGEERIFTWQVKVVDQVQPERTIENIIKINLEGLSGWEQVERPLLLTVGESVSFNNGAYWDLGGRRVGSGLLPPRVGETTEYLVVWSLNNSTGNFDAVSVETTLPPEVSFSSEVDIQEGELDFDSGTRVLSWSLNNFNNIIFPLTASFMVELVPIEEYRGQTMTLLNATTLSAQGLEDIIIRSRMLKTSDVVADTNEPIGIIQ